jgi:hypothetical protein
MNTDKRTVKARNESGNALFLILIAVALFAALSYAITQSGRGGGTVDKEQALITAAAIAEYPATLRTTITRMIITGTPGQGTNAVSVATTTSGATNQVFDAAGGGATPSPPPSGSAITSWVYIDANHATDGFYVQGVGTDATTTGREVLAVLAGCGTNTTDGSGCTTSNANTLTLTQCQQINKGLGQASPYTPSSPLLAVALWKRQAAGYAAGGAAGTLDVASGTNQPFLCISDVVGGGAAPYNYYHALVEQ